LLAGGSRLESDQKRGYFPLKQRVPEKGDLSVKAIRERKKMRFIHLFFFLGVSTNDALLERGHSERISARRERKATLPGRGTESLQRRKTEDRETILCR